MPRAAAGPESGSGAPWRTEPVDARADRAPSTAEQDQIVAEWLGTGRKESSGEQPAATGSAEARLRQAASKAERAVEDGAVSSRYERVLRRYFERLPREVAKKERAAAAGESAGPAPTAKDAGEP